MATSGVGDVISLTLRPVGSAGLTPGLLAALDMKRMVDVRQGPVPVPTPEAAAGRAARGLVPGDRPPLAAGAQDTHQAVDHLAHHNRSRAAAGPGGRDEGLDQRPFAIGQITWVAQPAAVAAGAVLGNAYRTASHMPGQTDLTMTAT